MKNRFVAIDFEHATSQKGTICSVGIAVFENGEIIDKYYSLVQPPNNEYTIHTINKHKITPDQTEKHPLFIDIYPEIKKRIQNHKIVAHGALHTDRHCLSQAMEIYGIYDDLNIEWVCTQQILEVSLDNACSQCNIQLEHHQALSDAIACGQLYNLYLQDKIDLNLLKENKDVKENSHKSYSTNYPAKIESDLLQPDFENATNKLTPFFMKKVVLTGFENELKDKLSNELKYKFGVDLDTSIGKMTNFLIIGETPGWSKLNKMNKLIESGSDARIITYQEYCEMTKI